jgi:hypothetical protein
VCGNRFTFEHFLSCSFLGHDLNPTLKLLIDSEEWKEVAVVLLTRFYVYVQAVRGGELHSDENDLFERLFAVEGAEADALEGLRV